MKEQFNKDWSTLSTDIHGNDKIVVAVSGGVDSMVLLHLIMSHPQINPQQLVVAHFNHCLRTESAVEAQAVSDYCREKKLACHISRWENRKSTANLEKQARDARYQFLGEVCALNGTKHLLTAHHLDDLAETILMKLTSGSRFGNLVGIRPISERDGLIIYRPLLNFSKEMINNFAAANQINYIEDKSNWDLTFKRNRYRHHIMPLLKEENPQVLKQFQRFVTQVDYAADLIEQTCDTYHDFIQPSMNGWTIDLARIKDLTVSEKYFLLDDLFQRYLIPLGVVVNQKQHHSVLELMDSDKSAGNIDLSGEWQVVKSYHILSLCKKKSEVASTRDILMTVGRCELPNGATIDVSPIEKTNVKQMDQNGFTLLLAEDQLPLIVRKPIPGDALVFNKAGQHKKVNRLFIDKKIPRELRGEYLVIEDNNKQILSLFSTEKSYLSITKETDKIQYRLTCFLNK